MCGRFAVYTKPDDIALYFGVSQPFHLEISYNIAPTENVSVICAFGDERMITTMRWGLIPPWTKDIKRCPLLINARLETVDTKPSFRQPIKSKRCLVIADGFYEWFHTAEGAKKPYFIHEQNNQPFAMAGIWDKWVGEERSIESCCIITTAANELIMPLHDRMPAIVPRSHYQQWLDPNERDWSSIKPLLTKETNQTLSMYPVSTMVNSAKVKSASCIAKCT